MTRFLRRFAAATCALAMVMAGPSLAQSDGDASKAARATQGYLEQVLRDPSMAEKLRSEALRGLEAAAQYQTRWREIRGASNQLQAFAISAVTLYQPEATGRPHLLIAVDFIALTAEPRLICGYLLWEARDASLLVSREEIGFADARQLSEAGPETFNEMVRALSCRMPPAPQG